jgi:hypothetical protein
VQLPVISSPASSLHVLAHTEVEVVVVPRIVARRRFLPPLLSFSLHTAVGLHGTGGFLYLPTPVWYTGYRLTRSNSLTDTVIFKADRAIPLLFFFALVVDEFFWSY